MERRHLIVAMCCAFAGMAMVGCGNKSPETTTTEPMSGSITDTHKTGGNSSYRGTEIGKVYEAYLSPQQEGGEEEDTPKSTPSQFKSTTPSKPRNERKDRGHGKLSFTKDLTKAIVEVELSDVNVDEITMFHIHCGRPSMLGPIIVDFSTATDIKANIKDDGVLALEVHNEDIEKVIENGKGIVGAFTAGCPIAPGLKDKMTTIGGLQYIAEEGDLYFNLHTSGQTYFGDIRGRLMEPFPGEEDKIEWKVAPEDAPKPSAGTEMHHH